MTLRHMIFIFMLPLVLGIKSHTCLTFPFYFLNMYSVPYEYGMKTVTHSTHNAHTVLLAYSYLNGIFACLLVIQVRI